MLNIKTNLKQFVITYVVGYIYYIIMTNTQIYWERDCMCMISINFESKYCFSYTDSKSCLMVFDVLKGQREGLLPAIHCGSCYHFSSSSGVLFVCVRPPRCLVIVWSLALYLCCLLTWHFLIIRLGDYRTSHLYLSKGSANLTPIHLLD